MRIAARGPLFPALVLVAFAACECDDAPLQPGDDAGPVEPSDGDAGALADAGPEPIDAGPQAPVLYLAIGDNVPPRAAARLSSRMAESSPEPVVVLDGDDEVPSGPAGSRLIAVGRSEARRALVSDEEVASLPPEGYRMRSGTVQGLPAIVVDGRGQDPDRYGLGDTGALFGAWALLEELGWAFLHPLAPLPPAALPASFPVVDRQDAPRWPVRNVHLHTMHPLELTDLLNGWGEAGVDDAEGFAAMLPEWDLFLEWMLANGQNEVEWVLLEAASWEDFSQSEERRLRLQTLVDAAHGFGVAAGVDVPIALQQQHTFRLVRETGTLEDEQAQIEDRLDWLMSAGFDFLSTENGSTEFTHPEPARMLAWIDHTAIHLDEVWGAPARIKIHCSTGQTADGYVDPDTGEPLNFNFLPTYADARVGVMPHTVQLYGLEDPAPTYGNTDFGYIREYLEEEAGRREVVWHPETAYWVSYDVDVPLFLPIYAERRLRDLRLIASREEQGLVGRGAHAGSRMDGQSIFSSGWEWGYWLNDVVAARAAWNPQLDAASDEEAFRRALLPLSRALGDAGPSTVDLLVDVVEDQASLLVFGDAGAGAPADPTRRNGQAYLQGVDAWDDLPDAAEDVGVHAPVTQPDKLGLVEMRNPLHAAPSYSGTIDVLLAAMATRFAAARDDLAAQAPFVDEGARPLFDDMLDSLRVTALRAKQVHGLYEYVDNLLDFDDSERMAALASARAALDEAAGIVAAREQSYRVPADRIAGWRDGPTAYEYGYLWTVRALYYWWRDEGKAVDAPASPCYLNLVSPADVALGEGTVTDVAGLLRELTEDGLLEGLGACLGAPSEEPTFPQDDLRSRP